MSTPDTIGPFRVLNAIAAGGMAEVYEVQDPLSNERFALKLLITVKSALERFEREYEAMIRLNHPGIVRVYQYGQHGEHPWFTMELLRGSPAQPWMKRIGKPGSAERTREVLRLGYHLATSLDYAHQRGLIHRDLKSANVLVLPDGRVKLVDFGTAHLTDAMRQITGPDEFVGTYAYASPEQVSGGTIDHRSDLYSLGILLYRLATGRRPFADEDPRALIYAHLQTPPPDPRELLPELPESFSTLVLGMMAKDPEARPRTADRVAAALEQIAGVSFGHSSPVAMHRPLSTGREVEIHRIDQELAKGAGALVAVTGGSGSDRTRVVDAALEGAIERKDRVFMCTLVEGDDLKAFFGMLLTLARQAPQSSTVAPQLVRYARASPRRLSSKRARAGLIKALLGTLEELVHEARVILGVHGLEHAGAFTLEMLGSLRTVAVQRTFPLSMVVDASDRAWLPGADLVRRFPNAEHVALAPLDVPQVALAVGYMLGRRPPPTWLASRLHAVSDGQPIYLEQAIKGLVRDGALEADEGNRLEWARRDQTIEFPVSVVDDADDQLRALPHLHRRVLQALALGDEEMPLDVLAGSLDWSVDELQCALVPLVRRQLVVVTGNRVGWRQGRMRSVIAADTLPRRVVVHEHRLLAAMIEHAPTPAQIRLLLANGSPEVAHQRCVSVAENALARSDYRRAYDVLLPVVTQTTNQTLPLQGEVHLLFARCLQVLHPLDTRGAKALAYAKRRLAGDPGRTAELELASAALARGIGHQANYEKHLTAAWEASTGSPLRASIALELAAGSRRRGQLKAAGRWVDEARKAAVTAGPNAMGAATLGSAELGIRLGRFAEAMDTAEKTRAFFAKEQAVLGEWYSVAVWATAARRVGRISEALRRVSAALPLARSAQDPAVYVELLFGAAWCEIDLCRLGRAQELSEEIAATLRGGEPVALRCEARLIKGRILLASGLIAQAEFVLRECHERAQAAGLITLSEAARAWWAEALWMRGERTAAQTAFKAALLGLKGTGDLPALADAVVARSGSVATLEEWNSIMAPLLPVLDQMPVVKLECELTSARLSKSTVAVGHAARSMKSLAEMLSDTDRAALRVHPWARRIRRGLGPIG